MIKYVMRTIGIGIFGIVFPVIILFQAYQGTNTLKDDVAYTTSVEDLRMHFVKSKADLKSANDYALFSLLYVEHANQKTMINKQVMKSVIVHIGFAVISVGMMLILLGIKDGGLVGSGEAAGIKFDFKTGSTGVAMFVVGALMATIGGVLKNDYQTSLIPDYEHMTSKQFHQKYENSLEAYQLCKKDETSFERCFTQLFFQINIERIK